MTEKKLPPGYIVTKAGHTKKPSLKQVRFAREYVSNGGNATRAAIESGYSPQTARGMAHENLSKPQVQELIEDFQKQVADAALISPESVATSLMEEAKGKEDSTASSRIQALKVLTDFVGSFDKNRQQVHHSGGIDLSDKSDDELKQILEGE